MEIKGDLNIDGTLTVNNAPVTGAGSITVAESDGNPPSFSATKITFNSNDFYIKRDSGSQPTINFRGSSGGGSSNPTLTVGETDSTPPDFSSVSTLRFDSQAFYLNPSSAGAPIVSIRPGGILTAGSIPYTAFDTSAKDVTSHFLLGSTLADTTLTVASNGATITATWTDTGGAGSPGIQILFGAGVLSSTSQGGALTATLTPGTDAVPTTNFLYVLETTPTVLTVSTSSFPDETTSHCRVGKVMCQSAASLQTQQPYFVHAYGDHIQQSNPAGTGHANHISRWIREQPATWVSGVSPTATVNAGPTPDTVTFSTTSGVVYQLHTQTFPAFADPADIYVANHPSGAYTKVSTMPGLTSGNTAIGGGDRINVVLWGAISSNTGDCKLFLNLPSGYYPSSNAALADASKFTNYTIPAAFRGEGFLIALFSLRYTTASGGTYLLENTIDLRGQFPSANGGGVGVTATEFSDATFRLDDNADATKQLAFEVSGITTGTTRTLTVQDRDGIVALTDQLNDFYHVTVVGSSGANPKFQTRKIIFGSSDFYLKADSQGNPVVRSRITSSSGSSGISGIDFLDGVHNFTTKTKVNFNDKHFYLSQTSTGDPMVNLRYEKDTIPIYLDLPTIQTIAVDPCAPYPYVIEKIEADCQSGSVTGGFYIITKANRATARDGTRVTGLDPLNINSNLQTTMATGANSVNAGDIVQFSVYGNSSSKRLRVVMTVKKPS